MSEAAVGPASEPAHGPVPALMVGLAALAAGPAHDVVHWPTLHLGQACQLATGLVSLSLIDLE